MEAIDEAIAKITQWLTENGYKLGHLGPCSHKKGMTGGRGVLVEPEWLPDDGAHTVKVTPTEIIQFTILRPTAYNSWMVKSQHSYSSKDELKKILDSLIKQPTGCW